LLLLGNAMSLFFGTLHTQSGLGCVDKIHSVGTINNVETS